MKKFFAILVIFIFAIGTVSAFAADAAKTTAKAAEPSTVKTFFSDAKTLVTEQIPGTLDKKSKTNRIFERTEAKAAPAAAATK